MPKILLVEDNEINRDMLSRRLQRRGYEVFFAVNGAEGVSKTLSDKPDIVLMDINLPGMNGWEATQQIKTNLQSKNIPVIALTAAMAGDSEKALAAGCDDYDTKPIDLPRLLEKIEVLLKKTKSQRQESITIPQDRRIQHTLLTLLRHELCTPMNAIIGYSEMLLDELKSQQDSTLFRDLQKIYTCGTQLLTLANAILDPAQLQMNQIYTPIQRTTAQGNSADWLWNIDTLGSTIRLELLTPLSTIIGYCEMLLEEASIKIISDLNRIHTAAQHLLSMINDIVNVSRQQLQAIDANGPDTPYLMLESPTATSLVQNADIIIHTLSEENPWAVVAVGGTLLVVDDNQTNCNLLERQLERRGYTVAVATNGPLALRMLQTMSVDLILLDIIMPGMNGFEVLQQIKHHEDWRHIPVIMLSALDEIDSVVRCVEMGAEDYVSKPFKPVLLYAKISACLEKKQLRDQQILTLAQRSITEATPVPVLLSLLSNGAILYANASAGTTFGLPVEELLNRHTQDFYLDPSKYQEVLDALSKAEFIPCWELGCQRTDGTPFWVTASLQLLRFNGEAAVLSALCDVTDRKQAEDSLRLAEKKYRSIFENACSGIYQSTPDGYFISINPAMARIHGYDSSAAMMEAVTEIGHQIYVDPNNQEKFRRLVEEQGEVTGFEYQAYRQDGDIIWVSESAHAVQDVSGRLLYYEGIVEDVSQHKLAISALKRQVEDLQIEINQYKRARQVDQITQTDYFQQLKAEAENLQFQDDDDQQRSIPKVLLVEDNEMNRDMLSRRLQRSGYEVAIVINGVEGVSKTASEKPDIVLMDMSLPVMNGWEATQQLKVNPQTRNIPIIALTAHAMAGDRETAMAAGCDDYDTKPIELPRLLGKIKILLEKGLPENI
ncbi:MAG: response regulator [Nostoc sp.]|uniref:response regulator n=1 Tax=Nostoc sp. TaxID=1180 RepID=UPI002FF94E82